METASKEDVHLVVLQHGLWGHHGNLEFLESSLRLHAKSSELPLRTLNSRVNEKKKTYDGIDLMGERLVSNIKEHVEELESKEGCRVKQLSFIGYSMGGLVARYAVGKLEYEGAFESGRFVPMNFVTIATPHLGAARSSDAWRHRTFNSLVPPISSWSGYHMMFKDQHALERPLLINMSDPDLPFFQGLQRFKKLAMFGNIHFDSMVPFRTATATLEDPFESSKSFFGRSKSLPAEDPDKYPSIRKPLENGLKETEQDEKASVGGAWLPIAVLILSPILIPVALVAVGVMVVQGKLHYSSRLDSRPDHEWVSASVGGGTALKVTIGDTVPASGTETESLMSKTGTTTNKILPEEEDPAISTPDRVLSSLSTLEHQEWVANHLNKLPWVKVAVDVRHGHSHAGIVVRIPQRFERRDQLKYLIEQIMEY